MTNESRPLPIRVLLPRKEDRAKKSGGPPKYDLKDYTSQRQQDLVVRVRSVREALSYRAKCNDSIPGVAVLRLRSTALAKTKRPTVLFNNNTCPVIGVASLGDLYVAITHTGLDALERLISPDTLSDQIKAAINSVEDLIPEIRRPDDEQISALIGTPLRVVMFDFANELHNHLIAQAARVLFEESDIKVLKETRYSSDLVVRRVLCSTESQVRALLDFGGIRSVDPMPTYQVAGPQVADPFGQTQVGDYPVPDPAKEYPVIGIVDSGIPVDHPQLSPWVYAHEDYVLLPQFKNPTHGTFVGGLAVFGAFLYGDGSPEMFTRVLDAHLIANWDKNYGPTTDVPEDSFLEDLREVVERYRHVVRIWNFSLSGDRRCSVNEFSPLAVALDSIQAENQVLFVIAAGNYKTPPLRTWPSQFAHENDRITHGADSVLGLTVGSIAERAIPTSAVGERKPSPFSRRGPAAAYIVKPDLIHFGGNCSIDARCTGTGVMSLTPTGSLREDVGTSFAVPRVSNLAGHLLHALTTPDSPTPSRDLIRALILHSTSHPDTGGPMRSKDEAYFYGFGLPGALNQILTCTSHSATLIYEGSLSTISSKIAIRNFPFPPSLVRNGKCYGQIRATLVYSPPLQSRYGPEYCRSNIDATIGTFYRDKGKKPSLHGKVDLEASEGYGLWEKDLVAHGFKWSPVKKYFANLNGIKSHPWGVNVVLTDREGQSTVDPIPFVLIITISDPQRQAPVYNEISQQLAARYTYMDLPVRESVRVQLQLT